MHLAEGKQAHVPLLAGWNRDEGTSEGMTTEKWNTFAMEQFKDRAEDFLKLYPGDSDEQAARSAADYNGDMFIAFGTWRWIEAHRKTGDSPIYRYHFELPSPPSKFDPVAGCLPLRRYRLRLRDAGYAARCCVAARESQAERPDDGLLDQLCEDR